MSTATDVPWAVTDGRSQVMVGRCDQCGHQFFPPQHFGCERCGGPGESLSRLAVAAEGFVLSEVTVHVHSSIPTPFHIAEIALDGLPLVIQAVAAMDAKAGTRVEGALVDRDGQSTFQFVPQGSDV